MPGNDGEPGIPGKDGIPGINGINGQYTNFPLALFLPLNNSIALSQTFLKT